MPSTNLFATAPVAAPKSKGKSAAKPLINIEGIEITAAIDHAIKYLTSLKETVSQPVKDVALERFIEEGIMTGKQPESFDATEGKGKANIQCKQRASNSGLKDIEEVVCREHKVPLGTSGGEYFFPAEHQAWVEKNGAKISKAFEKLGAPAGIIAKNPTKVIATEESIPFILQTFKAQRDIIEKLLPMVAVIALKPKFSSGDDTANEPALEFISKFLNPEEPVETSED